MRIFVLLFLAVLSEHLEESDSTNVISLPLQKTRLSSDIIRNNIGEELLYDGVAQTGKKRILHLKNVDNNYYYTAIAVGTPPQNVYVTPDTGSGTVWITSSVLCEHNSTICKIKNTYDHKKSKTYKEDDRTFRIEYLEGYVGGNVAKDVLKIAGLRVNDQEFGEATNVYQPFLDSKFDGVLGLTYTADRGGGNISSLTPFIVNLINQKLIKEAVFGIYLTKRESKKQPEITLGGFNPNHVKGEFLYTPVVSERKWIIQIDKIEVGGKVISEFMKAEPDAGSTGIAVSVELFDKLNTIWGAVPYDNGSMYVVECNKMSSLPDITFVFNDQPLSLHPENYLVQLDELPKNLCWIGFMGFEGLKGVVLGVNFMSQFYTLYDVGKLQVGFAEAA